MASWFCPSSVLSRCKLINLETLSRRRDNLCVFFVFDITTGRINAPYLLSVLNFRIPFRATRSVDTFRLPIHRTNYGQFEPMNNMSRLFNCVSNIYDLNLTRVSFRCRVQSASEFAV